MSDQDYYDWRPDGLCWGSDHRIWFPEHRGASVAKAVKLCFECPVQEQCLDHAVEEGYLYGVWGGYTIRPRRAMKKLEEFLPTDWWLEKYRTRREVDAKLIEHFGTRFPNVGRERFPSAETSEAVLEDTSFQCADCQTRYGVREPYPVSGPYSWHRRRPDNPPCKWARKCVTLNKKGYNDLKLLRQREETKRIKAKRKSDPDYKCDLCKQHYPKAKHPIESFGPPKRHHRNDIPICNWARDCQNLYFKNYRKFSIKK